MKPGCGYVSLSSDRPWQPQLLERKSSRALPARVEVHCSSHGSFLGREASPSLHLSWPRAAMRTNDKEIPAASGHGVEEEGGVSRAGFETFSALTETQVLSTRDVTHG